MKATFEIPDDLMRRIKLHAVQRNQKLNDAVAQLPEAGIATLPSAESPARPPRPARLTKHRRLTIDDFQVAIAAGRD
jgi:hypothetical protein